MKKILLIAAMAMVSSAAFAQKFAHVNSQEVLQLMPQMDEVREKMETINKDNEEVLKSMYDEFQTKYQLYQQKASTWTAAVRESKEKELSEIQTRVQETQQSMQQEMQQIQANLTAPVMKACQDAIDKIAKEGGYIYVFDATSVVYVDSAQSVDITPEVRKALNIPEGRTLESLQKELQAKADAAAQQ